MWAFLAIMSVGAVLHVRKGVVVQTSLEPGLDGAQSLVIQAY